MSTIQSSRLALLLAASASAFAMPPAMTDDGTAHELIAITQALMDAIPSGHAEVWQRYLADDAMLVDEFGRRQSKADAVASIHAFPQGVSGSIEIRAAEARRRGDTAVLDGEFFERETFFGQPFVVRYLFSNTFVRHANAWQLLASTTVTVPTPPPPLVVAGLAVADYPGVYRYAPERAFTVTRDGDRLFYATKTGGKPHALAAIARDVFMGDDDERNLLVFRRDAGGRVVELIERRKFNDLHLIRDGAGSATSH